MPEIISEKKRLDLQRRMSLLGISEGQIEESFVRSGGPGGQHVNKVATCVVLKYKPSGLVIKCQKERSQAMNRFWARRRLVERLEAERFGAESAEAKKIAKIRRQKRKRSRRAKDKMLEAKRRKGELKKSRGKLEDID